MKCGRCDCECLPGKGACEICIEEWSNWKPPADPPVAIGLDIDPIGTDGRIVAVDGVLYFVGAKQVELFLHSKSARRHGFLVTGPQVVIAAETDSGDWK